MTRYHPDRAYGERFMHLVRPIVGAHLLVPAPFEIDVSEASDLIVLRAELKAIGVRIRRPGYLEKYPNDFTIRSKRDNGIDTELAKIQDGWMDWMFYGHGNPEDCTPELRKWFLIDMDVWRHEIFRVCGSLEAAQKQGLACEINNKDGTHFLACDVTKYPPDLVIGTRSGPGPASELRAENAGLKAEIAALKAHLAELGRRPPHAPICATCGLLLNGQAFSIGGKYYHHGECLEARAGHP